MFKKLTIVLLPISAASLFSCGTQGDSLGTNNGDLATTLTLKCSNLQVSAGSIGSGQVATALAVQDQLGTQDSWSKYVEFAPGSVATCTYALPAGVSAQSVTGLRIRANYRGPARAEMAVNYALIDAQTSAPVPVGGNTTASSWVWSSATSTVASPLSSYFSSTSLKVKIAAVTTYDAFQLDELVVLADIAGTATPVDAGTSVGSGSGSASPPDAGTSSAGIKLPPVGKIVWDWQIGAATDANIVPPVSAKLMDVDGFNTSATAVSNMKSHGIYTVCYINAGSWQPGYPDSGQYPSYLKIQADPNWPGEWFLDITDVFKPNSVLATILRARLAMCKSKGFDALEPDNLQNDENVSGGRITLQQQIDFNGWIADEAHTAGLAVFQKNGPDKVLLKDRTGKMMVEKFDAILNEECQQFTECTSLTEYVRRGKLALDAEYSSAPNCTTSNSLNINIIGKDLVLAGGNVAGYKRIGCP